MRAKKRSNDKTNLGPFAIWSPTTYANQTKNKTKTKNAESAGPQASATEALARALQSPPTETPRLLM